MEEELVKQHRNALDWGRDEKLPFVDDGDLYGIDEKYAKDWLDLAEHFPENNEC